MTTEKISLVCTTYNEADSIADWCKSVLKGTLRPAQLVLVDSLSSDGTVDIVREIFSNSDVELVVHQERCNISRGRNLATSLASYDKIAVTDAGCTMEPDWLERISAALDEADWVGGYYQVGGDTWVQRSYGRLYNVPASKIDQKTFIPSSRSFGYRKSAWQQAGGYNEAYTIGEDTEFCYRLRSLGLRYCFVPEAIVYWNARNSLKGTWLQHYRYAYWDGVIGQNSGRSSHVIYSIVVLTPLLLGLAFLHMKLLIVGCVMNWIKPTINIRRSTVGRLADPAEVLMYNMIMLASAAGYLSGVCRRYAPKN